MFVFKGAAAAVDTSDDEVEREWRVADHYNIQQLAKRPFYTMLQPTSHHRSLTEDTRRPSLPQLRSRSNSSSAFRTLYEGTRPSPAPPLDQFTPGLSVDRRSFSSGSIHKRVGSSDSFGKSLMAKGSRLLRRQNSKHDLTSLKTLEWLEDVNSREELQGTSRRSGSWPSPIRSTGDEASPRYNISEPFNFQHLTHTTPQHVEGIRNTEHGDLISEFSAIRASQAPRRELRGIKARDIQQGIYFSEASASETSSPPHTGYSDSPPGTPAQDQEKTGGHWRDPPISATGRKMSNKSSIENFSQPSPSYHTAQSSPTSPPPRSSSRNKVPDFFTFHHESPTYPQFSPDIPAEDPEPLDYLPAAWTDGIYDSSLPHAVTTPDDTALPIRSPPFSLVRTELAGVPEEDEASEGKRSSISTSIVRPQTPSSIRHTKSFPNTKSSPARWSGALPHATEEDDDQWFRQNAKSVCTSAPFFEEHKEEVPLRPRVSRRISLRKEESWEDVIDYCYEHEAEADCNFDWELGSHAEGPCDAHISPVEKVAGDAGCLDFKVEAAETVGTTSGPETGVLERVLPNVAFQSPSTISQAYSDDQQPPNAGSIESSFSSISEAATPLPLEASMRPELSATNIKDWSLPGSSTPLVVSEESAPDYVYDDFYQKMLASHGTCNNQLPLLTGRVDGSTISNSPRSSRSPISKSSSQESFWHSQAGAAACRHRNTGSVGSLPDLVRSRSIDRPEPANDLPVEHMTLLETPDTSSDALRHQRGASLAKDVALKSILSKVMTTEVREVLDAPLPLHPAFRDRACSDTPAVPLPPQLPIPRRMRSPSSASNLSQQKSNRVSYSLFPSSVNR